MNTQEKFINIIDIANSGIYSDDEEFIVCVKCKKAGNIVQQWNSVGDAVCENCGTYQLEYLKQ